MATQDEIAQLRDELNKIQQQTKKSRTRAVVGFVLMVLVVLFAFLYAFVQSIAATKNAEEANHQRIKAEQSQQMADANAEEAVKQAVMADAARLETVKLNEELAKCRKSKR